jgi:hypothetical protein
MMALKKNIVIMLLLSIIILPFFTSCGHSEREDDIVIVPIESGATPKPEGQVHKQGSTKTPHVISVPKSDNFTTAELREIEKDGYLSYFYRRKYSPEEIRIVWHAVNTLFPEYSMDEKHQATRTILAYHWLVYRKTSFHNLPSNLEVTRQYEHLIDKYSRLHEVPAEMVKAVITWENSGCVAKESWAACVGVGQLSMGAVEAAHGYYVRHQEKLRGLARFYKARAEKFNFPLDHTRAIEYQNKVEFFDVAGRHRRMAKQLGIEDERLIPECNIEDAVIYLKMMYESYNNRMDLAISAYHNGSLNNNDIIRSYLSRRVGLNLADSMDHEKILDAVTRNNLKFIDLWNDTHSRNMLNGLRTVYGHITEDHNKHLALGDESDIYNWKVAAAYGALFASDETIRELMHKYSGEWDVAECRGLKLYSSTSEIDKDIQNGRLVKLPPVCASTGLSDLSGAPSDYQRSKAHYNYYVLPETAGMLISIGSEYQRRTGKPDVKIPLRAALESRRLELYPPGNIPQRYHTHLQGVAVSIDFDRAADPRTLRQIVEEMYMHDRIYWIRKDGINRICVNPRFGRRFFNIYHEYMKRQR